MRITQLLFLGLLATSLPVQFAIADAGGERAALARINHELQAIEPLITEAASQANPDARIQFQYDWLRQDLDKIRHGNLLLTHDGQAARARKAPVDAELLQASAQLGAGGAVSVWDTQAKGAVCVAEAEGGDGLVVGEGLTATAAWLERASMKSQGSAGRVSGSTQRSRSRRATRSSRPQRTPRASSRSTTPTTS